MAIYKYHLVIKKNIHLPHQDKHALSLMKNQKKKKRLNTRLELQQCQVHANVFFFDARHLIGYPNIASIYTDHTFVILMKGCWMFFSLRDVQHGSGGETEKYKMSILVFEIHYVSSESFPLFPEANMADIHANYPAAQNEYNSGQDA